MTFPKGARVRLTALHPTLSGSSDGPPIGACGTVTSHLSGLSCKVRFDAWDKGHGDANAEWHVPREKLEAIIKPSLDQAGTRVRMIKRYPATKPGPELGAVGTTTGGNTGSAYQVRWDDFTGGNDPKDMWYILAEHVEILDDEPAAPAAPAAPDTPHTFKVGDHGLTRDGKPYEVLAVNNSLLSVEIDGVNHGRHCYLDGNCFTDKRECPADLMPPTAHVFVPGNRVLAVSGNRKGHQGVVTKVSRYHVTVDFDDGRKNYTYCVGPEAARCLTVITPQPTADVPKLASDGRKFTAGDRVEYVGGAGFSTRTLIGLYGTVVSGNDLVGITVAFDTGETKAGLIPDNLQHVVPKEDSMEFNVGDIVEYTGADKVTVTKNLIGKRGKVINTTHEFCQVDWFNHAPRTCLKTNLRVVESTCVATKTPVGYVLGDRVVATGSHDGKMPTGFGTIVSNKSLITVRWDTWSDGHHGGQGDYSNTNHWHYSKTVSHSKLRHAEPSDVDVGVAFSTTPSTPKENTVNLLSPVKIEQRTFVTLPGLSAQDAKNLTDEHLLGAIRQAETAIEELQKLKTKPLVVRQQIEDLKNGIQAVTELLDARYRAANPELVSSDAPTPTDS